MFEFGNSDKRFWRNSFSRLVFFHWEGPEIDKKIINAFRKLKKTANKIVRQHNWGRSQTTFTRFVFFWPPTPLRLHFLRYKSLQKVDFMTTYPPTLVNVVCERPLSGKGCAVISQREDPFCVGDHSYIT